MKRSKAYRSRLVKGVCVSQVVSGRQGESATIGIDVGKESLFVALRWSDGTFERPWCVKNPCELGVLVELLGGLSSELSLAIGMESSGVYGDPLRQALSDAGLGVYRVEGKRTHDYAEIFDGVPSQHDGKDASVIAELVAFGKCREWVYGAESEQDQWLSYWVERLDIYQLEVQAWSGRLESLLCRHWPEVVDLLGFQSVTLLEALMEYGGPQGLSLAEGAGEQLSRWGGKFLSEKKIALLLSSAQSTRGVRQTVVDEERMRECARQLRLALREVSRAEQELKRLARGDEELCRQGQAVGLITACVLRSELGRASSYDSGEAYRKAMGLNLKERSSGKYQGQLRLTKRGSSRCRRWLYFAALREVQKPSVRSWYLRKKSRDSEKGKKGLVGVMRKLALALYRVSVEDVAYDSALLFPGSPTVAPLVTV